MTNDVNKYSVFSAKKKKATVKHGLYGDHEYAYNEFTFALKLVSFSLVLKHIINLSYDYNKLYLYM